jgi:uracil-DNA glycosylase
MDFDRVEAPDVRRRNLENLLDAAIAAKTDTIWVARDLGYRGGRRTGVALTDDVHLAAVSALFGGIPLERPTQGEIVAERTAAVIWRVLARINQPIFLWNVFPFHPHEPGNAFSNRCHTCAERNASLPLLFALIEMLSPKRLIAIGRDAQEALTGLDVDVIGVRHPSYGGQREFLEGVCAAHGVVINVDDDRRLPLLGSGCAAEASAAAA